MAPPFEPACSSDTLNLNPILLVNIQHSPYYQLLLESVATFNDLLPELYKTALAAPFFKGTQPSSFFCLLYRLGQLSPSPRQIQGLLESTRRPYAQALGALYIRYACAPKYLWSWLSPLLAKRDGSEPAKIKVDPRDSSPDGGVLLSEWTRELLLNSKYHGTVLPRIPIPIEREVRESLRELECQENDHRRSPGRDRESGSEKEKESEEELEEGETRSRSSHTRSRSRSRSKSRSMDRPRPSHKLYSSSRRDGDRYRPSYGRHERSQEQSRRRSRPRSRSRSRSRSRPRSRTSAVDPFGRDMPRDAYRTSSNSKRSNSRSKSR